jgi:hypothetical protein
MNSKHPICHFMMCPLQVFTFTWPSSGRSQTKECNNGRFCSRCSRPPWRWPRQGGNMPEAHHKVTNYCLLLIVQLQDQSTAWNTENIQSHILLCVQELPASYLGHDIQHWLTNWQFLCFSPIYPDKSQNSTWNQTTNITLLIISNSLTCILCMMDTT